MFFISHRGNITGKDETKENNPEYIDRAIFLGYEVELDFWLVDGEFFYLGHDYPKFQIDIGWLKSRSDKLWLHCKNVESVYFLNTLDNNYHYFWHQNDTLTLTSRNYMWVLPGNQPIKNSICVLPEINNENTEQCIGICSDFIKYYVDKNNNI